MTTAPPVSTELLQVMAPDGTIVDPAFAETVPDDDILALYEAMLAQRTYDDRMIKMQRQGRLGFYLACTGEEVCSYGPAYALRKDDWLFPAYREPGTALWRGMPFQAWVDNMVGNVDDPAKGRQMPVHWTARAQNVVSISSPVGTQIPQCTGTAYAMKVSGTDSVACCFFGEGTSSEGDFHAGINFAAVWKAPAIFFCRNNKYAISTPYHKTTAVEHIVLRAHGYGMRGQLVDGNDLLGVIKAMREAADWARNGDGPTLLEALTYRLAAHSTSDDPRVYRSREEELQWLVKDPLIRLKAYLIGKKLWDEERDVASTEAASKRIIEALTLAESKAHPQVGEMFDDVFADMPPHLARQREQLLAYMATGKADYKAPATA